MFVMPRGFVALLPIYLSFLCFGLLVGLDPEPMVFIIIHTPLPISKGFDHPFCMSMLACLLLCFMLVLASLILGFATLYVFSGRVVMWLQPMPMRPCLDATTWDALP